MWENISINISPKQPVFSLSLSCCINTINSVVKLQACCGRERDGPSSCLCQLSYRSLGWTCLGLCLTNVLYHMFLDGWFRRLVSSWEHCSKAVSFSLLFCTGKTIGVERGLYKSVGSWPRSKSYKSDNLEWGP